MFEYRKATIEDLKKIWNKDISENTDDLRYVRWKTNFIESNKNGDVATFVVLVDNEPVGQISIIFNSQNIKNECKNLLCDNKYTAHMSTFRIDKKYEGQGHISKLVKLAEAYAQNKGIKYLSIGTEAKESRNLSIYLHWGYNHFLTSSVENGELILFYKKTL